MTRPTVLVTNDDGVASPGLAALVRAVTGPGGRSIGHSRGEVPVTGPGGRSIGHSRGEVPVTGPGWRVVVAAPSSDQSGTSAAVAPRAPEGVRVERVSIAGVHEQGFEELVAFAVDGPPALAVLAARLGELGAAAASATVVAAGINIGANTGGVVLFSGTVGAALAASSLGLSALAVSINSIAPRHLATATVVAAAALDWLVDAPPATVLNVNVPDLAIDRLAGVRQAPLARFGSVQIAAREPGPDPFAVQLRVSESEPPAGSDTALLRAGWVTVTPLLGVTADQDAEVAAFIERAVSRAA